MTWITLALLALVVFLGLKLRKADRDCDFLAKQLVDCNRELNTLTVDRRKLSHQLWRVEQAALAHRQAQDPARRAAHDCALYATLNDKMEASPGKEDAA